MYTITTKEFACFQLYPFFCIFNMDDNVLKANFACFAICNNWMDLTKLYRTCHYMKAYKGIHCLCCYLYIEGIGQWQAD